MWTLKHNPSVLRSKFMWPATFLGFVGVLFMADTNGAHAGANQGIAVAPHRAVYSMKLASDSPPGMILSGRGKLVFEWAESCDSWEIQQRMALELVDKNDRQFVIDASFTSTESKDGLHYRFSTIQNNNGGVDKDLRGRGILDKMDGPGEVRFSRPKGTQIELPRGTMFPTDHILMLLRAARSGRKHVTRFVYDGDNIEAPYEVSAAIGKRLAADKAPIKRPLADQDFWRMRLAYFPSGSKNEIPESEIGIFLQENGVARALVLDYGDYKLDVELDSIEKLPNPDCG